VPVNPPPPETASAFLQIAVLLSALLAVVWGLVQCFCGHRLIRIVLAFYGFIGGILAGALAGLFLFNLSGTSAVVVALAAGVAGAVLLVVLLYANVVLLGAALGALAGALLAGIPVLLLVSPKAHAMPRPALYIVLAAALVGAVLALVYRRFVIILLTAAGGALLIAAGILLAIGDPLALALLTGGRPDLPAIRSMLTQTHLIALLCCLALALLGFAMQYRTAGLRAATGKRDRNLDRLLARARRDR